MNPSDLLPEAARRALSAVNGATGERHVVFDADGTLWAGDVGEYLLQKLIDLKRVPADVTWAQYVELHQRDPAGAYAHTVEVLAGFSEAQLQALCRDVIEREFVPQVFPHVRPFLQALTSAGATVWVCSASPRWAVEAGVRPLGISASRVLAVQCPVEDGVLTGKVDLPVPAGEGKVHALKTRGVRPVLASGNGDLDLPMLSYSENQLVITPRGAENALVRTAQERGWPVLEVTPP